MKIYLSGIELAKEWFLNGAICSSEVYALESFYSIKDWEIQYISQFKGFLLDSGAFTFLSNRKKHDSIDWDSYIQRYGDFINKYNIDLFFELDIDSLVGLDEVERLRNKLQFITKKKPIPVWHKNRGKEYFIDMCKNYPYVALGGIVIREIPIGIYEKAFPWFIKIAHENDCKIHGLGYTRLTNLKKYAFDSVDSTSWIIGQKFGKLQEFKNSRIIDHDSVIKGRKIRRIKNYHEVNLNNFNEWVKFQKYANKHL